MRLCSALLSLTGLAATVGRPYFYMQEGSEKCFEQNVPVPKSPLVVAYQTDTHVVGLDCQLSVRNPEGNILALRSVVPSEPRGTVAAVAEAPGVYWVCVSCKNSHWLESSSVKWTLHVDFMDSGVAQTDGIAKGSTMKKMHGTLNLCQHLIERLVTYEHYQRTSERTMNSSIEGLRKLIIASNVFVTLVVISGLAYSSRLLLRFFKRQKVV